MATILRRLKAVVRSTHTYDANPVSGRSFPTPCTPIDKAESPMIKWGQFRKVR